MKAKTLNRVELKDFMIGSLLGDANLRKRGPRAQATYREAHKAGQKPYLLWKRDIMEHNLDVTFYMRDFINNYNKPSVSLDSHVHGYFTELYDHFYLPVKRMPFDMMERNFSWFGMAVFYQDDGSTDWKKNGNINCCEFHVQDYRKEDVIKFQEFILRRFGLVSCLGSSKGKPKIRLYGDSGRKLLKEITPYMQDCLKYKIDFEDYKINAPRKDMKIKRRMDQPCVKPLERPTLDKPDEATR